MSTQVAAALVIAALISAFLVGGRYQAVSTDKIVYVIDRFTGEVRFCAGRSCKFSRNPVRRSVPAPRLPGASQDFEPMSEEDKRRLGG